MVKQQNIKLVSDVKVMPNDECVTQHKIVVCDARIAKSLDCCKKLFPKRCVWKLQKADICDKFCGSFTSEINDTGGEQVENTWFT